MSVQESASIKSLGQKRYQATDDASLKATLARNAYQQGDIEASIQAHKSHNTERHSSGGGGYLKAIVYGGLDGIITTFATVTSVAGANLSPSIILILGIAHLFADGISMGVGDAMSEQAEVDFNLSERKREQWEMENNMEGEVDEMVELYTKKGLSEKDARDMMNIMSKYPEVFLDTMMVEELGMLRVDDDPWEPIKSGLVTFGAFVCFGCVPLLVYLICLIPGLGMEVENQFHVACVLTVATLAVLGALKGRLIENQASIWKSAVSMALNGTFAAAIGYVLGFVLQRWIGQSL